MDKRCLNRKAGGLLLTMLATAILGAAGCSKTPTAQELVAEAKQYQQKGDTKSAIIQLRNALQKTPDNPEIRYLLGTIYDQAGDAKSAEKELRKALELRMDRAKALPVLAHSLLAQGEFQKVLDVTKTDVGSKTENSAEILAMRGNALLALDRIEDAKKSFEDALAKNPDHAEALLGQARLAVSTKNIDAAIELIDRANKSDPKNVDAMLMKGDVQRLIPNNEAAAAAYEKVIAVYPQNIPARLNLASIQIGMGSYAEARKNIEVVRKIAPRSPMANFMQALIDFRNSNYAPAQEAIQEVLKASPTHVPSVLLAGLIEQALGQYAQAEKHLAWVLEKSPENLYARRMLTAVLVKERQPQRAINVLQTGLKQAPGDTGLLVLAGEAYMQLNDFSNATLLRKGGLPGSKKRGGKKSLVRGDCRLVRVGRGMGRRLSDSRPLRGVSPGLRGYSNHAETASFRFGGATQYGSAGCHDEPYPDQPA